MTWNEFIGHNTCSWRYSKLLWMIETQSIEQVQVLREHHLKFKRNPNYNELDAKFKERLGL